MLENSKNLEADLAGQSIFVPMSHDQMVKTKGGTDYPSWFTDLFDQAQNVLEQLGLTGLGGIDSEEEFFEEHGSQLEDLGIEPLDS